MQFVNFLKDFDFYFTDFDFVHNTIEIKNKCTRVNSFKIKNKCTRVNSFEWESLKKA